MMALESSSSRSVAMNRREILLKSGAFVGAATSTLLGQNPAEQSLSRKLKIVVTGGHPESLSTDAAGPLPA